MITKEQVTFRKEAVDNFSYKHICTYTVTTESIESRYADEKRTQSILLLMLNYKVFGKIRIAYLDLHRIMLGQKEISNDMKSRLFKLADLLPL